MILKQYYLACLSQASYLIGDEGTATAAVVDPRRDVEEYLADAEELGLVIRHVLLTHFHADFASGHLELREKAGASIHLGARAEAEYPFEPMADGGSLALGRVRLEFLETPGHTPESVSIVVYDLDRSEAEPHAVLTGDALFVGDVGRPDLLASAGVTAEELGGMLYDSLHQKLLRLPDATIVYPAHGAGSACGKHMSSETSSTIGEQRRFNYALQPMSREEFVRLVSEGQVPAPDYFAYDAALNKREHPLLEASLARGLRPLDLEAFLEQQAGGAQVLDCRDPAAFAAGHLAGSVNVGLGGRFAEWAGTVLDQDRPILLVAEPGREEEAATRLGRIGFDQVAGFLEGGPAALAGRPERVRTIRRFTARELAAALDGSGAPVVLDVRDPGERELARIDGTAHIPLRSLRDRLTEVPTGRPLVIHCAGGYRSMIAASLLEQAGHEDLADLEGGLRAWQAEAGVAPSQA